MKSWVDSDLENEQKVPLAEIAKNVGTSGILVMKQFFL